jgi:hypothetical protein
MRKQPGHTLAVTYHQAWRAATDGERRYLAAVAGGRQAEQCSALAMQARDLWSEVVTVCGRFEAPARDKVAALPLVNRLQALHRAWAELSDWTSRGDAASSRTQLFASLAGAHLGELPETDGVVRLDAGKQMTHVTPSNGNFT